MAIEFRLKPVSVPLRISGFMFGKLYPKKISDRIGARSDPPSRKRAPIQQVGGING